MSGPTGHRLATAAGTPLRRRLSHAYRPAQPSARVKPNGASELSAPDTYLLCIGPRNTRRLTSGRFVNSARRVPL